jgi:hypothetical protein
MHPYQKRLSDNFYEYDEGIAVLCVGGGKTVIALTAIADLLEDGAIRRALVVAPKKVCENVWPDEHEHWTHLRHLKIGIATGTPKQRQAVLDSDCDVVVTGYHNIEWLLGTRKKGKKVAGAIEAHPELFDYILYDEISKLRNPSGTWAKTAARVTPRFKIRHGMLASVRPKNLLNIFMPGRIISGNRMFGRDYTVFRKRHFYSTDYNDFNWEPHEHYVPQLIDRFNQWAFTVADEELPKTLKPHIIDRFYTLPPAARRTYNDMFGTLIADAGGIEIVAANAAVKTGKLQQIAAGFMYEKKVTFEWLQYPDGIDGREITHNETHIIHNELIDTLAELLDDEIPEDEPTLVAYWFEATQQRIRERWPDMVFMDGTNDASIMERWNNKELPRLALHPASAGHGLNLQYGGRYLVLAEPFWDAELYEQIVGRIARQGQELQPYVYRLAGKDTIGATGCIPVCERRLTEQQAVMQAIRRI